MTIAIARAKLALHTRVRGGSPKRSRRTAAPGVRNEDALHRSVAAFLDVALKPPTIWTTIGHGGGGRVRGAQLKAKGVKRGWPDIIVMHPAGHYETKVLGIELKAGKGRLGEHQVDVMEMFGRVNGKFSVCRSIDDVEAALAFWNIPVHARGLTRAA